MDNREDIERYKTGKDLVNQFSVVLRTAHIHDPDNIAVMSVIDKFVSIVNFFIAHERVISLELRGEYFYINDYRIRYSLEYLLNFDFLLREFKKRELGSLVFKDKITAEEVKVLVRALLLSSFAESSFDAIEEKMAHARNISVGRLQKVVEDSSLEPRKMVKKTYFNAVSYTKGVINRIKSGEKVNIKKAKRIIENMVDHILEEEQLLLGMTAIKDYDEYTYHHSVNVSIFSIALGQRVGLNRKTLTELGMVALFHDIGKMDIPNEILNKPSNFSDSEWDIIRRHPIWGVKTMLKLKKLDPLTIKSAIVSFEHHMNYDHSGYPRVRKDLKLDFYSKIVCLADQYDAMTSSRVYSRVPLAPDKALSIMMERSNTQLDPLLMKFFVNMVGVFPIGTLVMLSTKELGLVCESNHVFPTRPRVLIIIDEKGNKVKGHVVDLTEKNEQELYLRSILKTMDPNKYRINLAEYLL